MSYPKFAGETFEKTGLLAGVPWMFQKNMQLLWPNIRPSVAVAGAPWRKIVGVDRGDVRPRSRSCRAGQQMMARGPQTFYQCGAPER